MNLNRSLHPEPAREPNSVEDKPLQGQGNHNARERGTRHMSAPREGEGGQSLRTRVKVTVGGQTVDLSD